MWICSTRSPVRYSSSTVAISFGAGGVRIPYPTYHNTRDVPALITPEIMEDLAQILFVAITDMADEETLELR